MEQQDGEDLGMSFQEIFETAVHAVNENPVRVSSYERSESEEYFHFDGQTSHPIVSSVLDSQLKFLFKTIEQIVL